MFADMFMIRQKEIRKMGYSRVQRLKIYPKIGFVPSAAWEKKISRQWIKHPLNPAALSCSGCRFFFDDPTGFSQEFYRSLLPIIQNN